MYSFAPDYQKQIQVQVQRKPISTWINTTWINTYIEDDLRDIEFDTEASLVPAKSNQLAPLFLDESTADVRFIFKNDNGNEEVESEKLPAHKCILATCSPVFKTMFFGSLSELGDVHLTDATPEGFKEFLQYFYKDEIKLTVRNAPEVVYLSKKYEVKELLAICSNFLQQNLSLDQICIGLELAVKFDMHELVECCKSQIIHNLAQFLESEAFVGYSIDYLKTILLWDEPKVYSHKLFVGCYQWGRNAWKQHHGSQNEPLMSDVRSQLNDCFALIEFSSMKSHEIVSILAEYTELFTTSDLVMIHKILATKYHGKLDDCTEFTCYLRKVSNGQIYDLEKFKTITFQSSRKLFFVGFRWSWRTEWDFAHVSLIKKSSNPNEIGDIVLERLKHISSSIEYDMRTTDMIAIEPNTKYELQFKIYCDKPMKYYYIDPIFTSNICDLANNERVSIEGKSIISSLLFKYRKNIIEN